MPDSRANLVERLFHDSADLQGDARHRFLDEQCGTDAELRSEVEALLRHNEAAPERFLEGRDSSIDPKTDAVPASIGHYTIIRKIGEGGMGVVYKATQERPHRTVALKVLRSGFVSKSILRRFQYEAEVLGHLQHPGIAHIYEAGMAATVERDSSSREQAFFAMELIQGQPLTAYTEKSDLSTRHRMELLAKVCDAVQHAHQKGVIHRDLKPGNILVDESGQPKILDFGVARATDADLQTVTMRTDVGQLVGTIPYMSPEQVSGDSRQVDTRSDVYALGVILFEVLTGRLPHDVRKRTIPEAVRIIREEEPSRLSSINPLFRGDVETIVAKALEKDKDRRYQSAAEMAADIRRYLRDEPIVARRASSVYQLRKFAKRNKALVAGVVTTLLTLVVGISIATWLAIGQSRLRHVAERHQVLAQRQQERAEQLAYRASIAAAASAMQSPNVASARQNLVNAPEALRGWEWHHLESRLDDSLHSLSLPGRCVETVGFTAEGNLRAVAYHREQLGQSSVISFDLALGEITSERKIESNSRPILSQDGRRISYIGIDGVWRDEDSATGVSIIKDNIDRSGDQEYDVDTTLVCESPNGRLEVLFADGMCSLVDRTTGARHALRELSSKPHTAVFSPDGSMLAYDIGTLDASEAVVLNTATLELSHRFHGHTESVMVVAFRPDGKRLLSGSADHTLRLWNLETGTPAGWRMAHDHSDKVLALAFSPNGKLVASAGEDRTVRLRNARTGGLIAVLVGHEATITTLAFNIDGSLIATGDQDGAVRVWDASALGDARVLRGHTLYVYSVALTSDGSRIVSGAWDGAVRIWDTESGEHIATMNHTNTRRMVVPWLAVSPNDDRIAVIETEPDHPVKSSIRIIDANTGHTVTRIGSQGPFYSRVDFDPSGQFLAGATKTDTLTVWNTTEFDIVAHLEGRQFAVFEPKDGTFLATSSGAEIILYETDSFQEVARLRGHGALIRHAAFSPDGTLLASAGDDRTVRVWDVVRAEQLAVLTGHTDTVFCVAFSPDATRIASGSNDQTIRLWDTTNFTQVAKLDGHTEHVHSVVFGPRGKRIISGSGDYTVRIWETDPLRVRIEARRKRREVVTRMEPLLEGLFKRLGDASQVMASLRAEPALSERTREIALQVALRKSIERLRTAEIRGD